MTLIGFIFACSDYNGAPWSVILLAMICDTLLLCTAMLTGIIHA